MTMQQIDITSETNGGHVIKLVDATLGNGTGNNGCGPFSRKENRV